MTDNQPFNASITDSLIFRDIFSTEDLRRIWADEHRTQRYLDVEAALAKTQSRLGIIPADAAAVLEADLAATIAAAVATAPALIL